MQWDVLEKVVRCHGKSAYADIVLQRQDDLSPFLYAIVDEKKDKAIVMKADCQSLDDAKYVAAGSLLMYEAIQQNKNHNPLFAIEDEVIMVSIRTEYGDKYEPIALSGNLTGQVQNIIQSANELFDSLNAKEV
jgi:hypothetical protein